jgi:hypothetical protein
MKSTVLTLCYTALACTSLHAAETGAARNQFTQEIHVVNLLANHDLPDPGMTPTAVIVDYYNGGSWPCWTNHLAYHEDATIHAGPTQGCREKVTRVVISPTLTADKLKTYQAPFHIELEPAKYSTQIMIVQNTPPTFDSQTGLAIVSGTAKAQLQAQFKSE